MEKWRSWLWFKQRFVYSLKSTLLKPASSSRHKSRGKTELIRINPYVFMPSPAFRYLSNGSICVLQPRRFHDTCKVKSNWASNTKMDLLCVELSWLWGTGVFVKRKHLCSATACHLRDTYNVKGNWASNIEMDLFCVELLWLWGASMGLSTKKA
ncbi:hypothetical protein POTOM_051970 [Populus tomentosa]|uniref:Uncharacterized protein n=1 Tax=Populus tomentosa TaxID=118781 RepID=A0A8X7Y317_POPTO|nr:hypothetical protein POTOM_051970 [Populus tomentosa]